MPMAIHPDELRNIEDLISAGEERMSEQQDRVARLEQEGLDATAAREMLLILQNSQSLLISRRNLLLRQS
jgi:hypothetical protein